MTHDFDEAMNYPTAFLNVEGGYIPSQELNERVKETTQFALRLAKRLMDEPSHKIDVVGSQAFYAPIGQVPACNDTIRQMRMSNAFKAMRDQLIKEVEQEK
jgi:hypothetical protein